MAVLTQYGLGFVLALHGLVHAWYVVLSRDWVEYEEAMGWNGESWLLTRALPQELVLDVASVLYVVVAVGFVVGGLGYALAQEWATSVLVASAVLSSVVIVLMWDGRFDQLTEKGAIGVLVNAVVLGWMLVLQ